MQVAAIVVFYSAALLCYYGEGSDIISINDLTFTGGFVEELSYGSQDCTGLTSRRYIAIGKCTAFNGFYSTLGYTIKNGKVSVYSAASDKSDCSNLRGPYQSYPTNASISCVNYQTHGVVSLYAPLTYGYTIAEYGNHQTCVANDPSTSYNVQLYDSDWVVTYTSASSTAYSQSLCRNIPGGIEVGRQSVSISTYDSVGLVVGFSPVTYSNKYMTSTDGSCPDTGYISNFKCAEAPLTLPQNVAFIQDIVYPKSYYKTTTYLTSDCSGSPYQISYQPIGVCVKSGDATKNEMWGYIAKSANEYDIYIAGYQGDCSSPMSYIYNRAHAVTGMCVPSTEGTPTTYSVAEFVPTIGSSTAGLYLSYFHSQEVCQMKGVPDWTGVEYTNTCIHLSSPYNGFNSAVHMCATGQDGSVTASMSAYKTTDCTGPATVVSTSVFSAMCGYNGDSSAYVVAKCTVSPSLKPTPLPSAKPTAKPSAKPTAKPSAKPVAKPSAKPTAKPSAKPIAKPSAKPVAKPTLKPTIKPTGKPVDKAAKVAKKPTLHHTKKPVAKATKKPVTHKL